MRVTVSKRATARSPSSLRVPNMILRHWTAVRSARSAALLVGSKKPKETLALEKKPAVLIIRIDPPPEGRAGGQDPAEPRQLTDAPEHRAWGQDIPTVAMNR